MFTQTIDIGIKQNHSCVTEVTNYNSGIEYTNWCQATGNVKLNPQTFKSQSYLYVQRHSWHIVTSASWWLTGSCRTWGISCGLHV